MNSEDSRDQAIRYWAEFIRAGRMHTAGSANRDQPAAEGEPLKDSSQAPAKTSRSSGELREIERTLPQDENQAREINRGNLTVSP